MTSPATTDPILHLPDEAAAAVDAAMGRAQAEDWIERLHDRDTSLWSDDPIVQAAIAERLGWLDAPEHFSDQIPSLEGFAAGIHAAGFRQALVMGMGGSSLAPEVMARTLGTADGGIPVTVLDSTDPAAVAATFSALDPLSTLYVVASKSGTTTEPQAFQAEAWQRVGTALESHGAHQSPGELMIAITDPGPSLKAIPHHDDLREVFLNPSDVGGRYSALTYVGLVPAALMGHDIDALLANAVAMLGRCRQPDPTRNPGAGLGIAIGALARDGRDKLTFLTDPAIGSFGAWAEQLLAESTGKHGTGIVPIDLEPVAPATSYGDDRAFVRLALAGSPDPAAADLDALAGALAAAGQPVIRVELAEPLDIAGEFVRWEIATALAGAVLGIDPFDQPNVEEAKERTRRLLDGHGDDDDATDGRTAAGSPDAPLATAGNLTLYGDTALLLTDGDRTVGGELVRHVGRIRPDGYLAIQAFVAPTPGATEAIARLRRLLMERTGRPTTAGFGPRFLHSTGQLHKGGPPTGWFLQLTSDHPDDPEIPGWSYTWGRLIDAQAAGDFGAIEAHQLPILRVGLGPDVEAGLAELEPALAAALDARREG